MKFSIKTILWIQVIEQNLRCPSPHQPAKHTSHSSLLISWHRISSAMSWIRRLTVSFDRDGVKVTGRFFSVDSSTHCHCSRLYVFTNCVCLFPLCNLVCNRIWCRLSFGRSCSSLCYHLLLPLVNPFPFAGKSLLFFFFLAWSGCLVCKCLFIFAGFKLSWARTSKQHTEDDEYH